MQHDVGTRLRFRLSVSKCSISAKGPPGQKDCGLWDMGGALMLEHFQLFIVEDKSSH